MTDTQIRAAFEEWQGDPFVKHGIARDAWFAAVKWSRQEGELEEADRNRIPGFIETISTQHGTFQYVRWADYKELKAQLEAKSDLCLEGRILIDELRECLLECLSELCHANSNEGTRMEVYSGVTKRRNEALAKYKERGE